MCTCPFMCDSTRGGQRATSGVSCPLSLFIAVCSELADLLVSGDSSVPTSPLGGGGLTCLLHNTHPASLRFCGSALHSECSIH